ncbi:phosphatase PAP2 family protein [Salinisphaera sp. T31B1]|uniref:phosphatase PAP2 family protein n=1 Tax=Salinisphaera sp. T31B1 TaxID=727963 RepID=UPI0033408BA4
MSPRSLDSRHTIARPERALLWLADPVLIWPVVLLVCALVAVHWLDLDMRLADTLYRIEGGRWSLRYTWLTSEVLHKGSQRLSIVIGVVTLATIVCSGFVGRLRPYRRGLVAAFAAAITSLLIVSLFKHQLPFACPYDMQRYGGKLAARSVSELFWHQDVSGCFPAGHAAGGYCFVVWFFFARHYRLPYYGYVGLPGMVLGLVNGIDQQLRGAHFLSHDLSAILLCWVVGYAVFHGVVGRSPRVSHAALRKSSA